MLQVVKWVAKRNTIITFWDFAGDIILCYVQYFFELCDFSLGDISSIISLQPALKFNGGGHINHSIFWTNLSPDGGGEPTGAYLYKKKWKERHWG